MRPPAEIERLEKFPPERQRRHAALIIAAKELFRKNRFPPHPAATVTIAPGPTAASRFILAYLPCVLVAYIVVFAWRSPLAIQDLPNHLARAYVMADLMFHQGAEFGGFFEYHFLFIPYVLGDVALSALVELLGAAHAAVSWTLLVFLSLPAALLMYLRALRVAPEYRSLLLILSLYLATDRFFMMGLLSFRLGIAAMFVALALIESLRTRWSPWRYALLVVVTIVVYLIHLAPVAFLATAIVATGAIRLYRRTTRLEREIYFLVPAVGLIALSLLTVAGYRQPHDEVAEEFVWGTPALKLMGLAWDFYRLVPHWDQLLVILAAGSVLLATGAGWSRRAAPDGGAVSETWALAISFLAIYVAMPAQYAEASLIDVRVCAVLIIFLIVGCARVAETRSTQSLALWAAGGLAAVAAAFNLAYLGNHLRQDEAWLNRYRALTAAIPQHSRVLPVYTARNQGGIRPFLHAGAYTVIDRNAVIPYLFSGDRGDPMKYFRYLHRPYAPHEEWYNLHDTTAAEVDWNQVSREYRYLLIMKPFDPGRLPASSRKIAENEVGAVLTIR